MIGVDEYEDSATGFRLYAHDPDIDGPPVDLLMPPHGVTDPGNPNGPCPKASGGERHYWISWKGPRIYCFHCRKTLPEGVFA